MQQVLETKNNNQPQAIGQLIKQLYQGLTFGQKRRLLMQYVALYGNRSTFYNKVNGKVRLMPSEKIFFTNSLNPVTQNQNLLTQNVD